MRKHEISMRIGVDVVEVARFRRFVERHGGRLGDLFSPEERRCCESSRNRIERYAARFAAKESFLKALGEIGVLDFDGVHYRWTDIEVVTDLLGAPTLRLHGNVSSQANAAGVEAIAVSVSHTATIAVAQVLLTFVDDRRGGLHADR